MQDGERRDGYNPLTDWNLAARLVRKTIPNSPPEERVTELLEQLGNNVGLVIYPKRQLLVPELTRETVPASFGDDSVNVWGHIERMSKYLASFPVGDHFGSNHEERRVSRNQLFIRLREESTDIAEFYFNLVKTYNQFAMNNISSIRMSLLLLDRLVNKVSVGSLVGQAAKDVSGLINDYNGVESLDEKLVVVHKTEDNLVDVLSFLGSL
jgi:hypothetical protein